MIVITMAKNRKFIVKEGSATHEHYQNSVVIMIILFAICVLHLKFKCSKKRKQFENFPFSSL